MYFKTVAALGSLALTLACASPAAQAQEKRIFPPSSTIGLQGVAYGEVGEIAQAVSAAFPLPVWCVVGCGGGGGGGGAVTVADGADVALGARADTAWAGTGSGSVVAILKATRALQAGIDAKLGGTLSVNCVSGCAAEGGGEAGGADGFVQIPANGSTALATPTKGVLITEAGSLGLEMADGTNNNTQLLPVVAGQVFPFHAVRRSAGNTAGVLGLK